MMKYLQVTHEYCNGPGLDRKTFPMCGQGYWFKFYEKDLGPLGRVPVGALVVVDTARGFQLGRVIGYANNEKELKEKGCDRKVLKQVVGVVDTTPYSARRRLQLDYEKADLELRHWIQKNGLDEVYSILADMSIEFKGRLYQRNALKQEIEQDEQ
jgi:hypothetical protein